ncbi:hypothetical protein [Streptomyces sp. NPDC053079]|uniref:hypothetical protein n=1 Tax=Streptomyces sp. NPDC053079 TaxID=3365697 RepID=UPI0037D473CB
MSSNAPVESPEAPAPPPKPVPAWDEPTAARAEIERLNAELAAHLARVAELEPAAAELHQLREAEKSEVQKLMERAETAERAAEQSRAELLRAPVAQAKGLSPQQAARLVGATREELEADADDLLATFTPAPEQAAAGGPLMMPDPSQGTSGQLPAGDPAQMFAAIIRNTLHR